MRKRFALLYNRSAGIAVPRLLDAVLARVRARGSDVFQLPARNADEAAAAVSEVIAAEGCDAVIAAGGDGTVRAAATGAQGRDFPVGLIPLGTGNVLAREIGLGRSAAAIANTLCDGPTIDFRGGLANGNPFFLMAGVGFDASIVRGLHQPSKRVLGRLAYVAPALRSMKLVPELFDAEFDGQRYQASWVIMTNCSRYGGSFVLTRDAAVGANKFLAVIVAARTRSQFIAAGHALARGVLAEPGRRPKFVEVLEFQTARIGRTTSAYVQLDGDEAGTTPLTVSSSGPSVRLIVPPRYVADLTNRHANHLLSSC